MVSVQAVEVSQFLAEGNLLAWRWIKVKACGQCKHQ